MANLDHILTFSIDHNIGFRVIENSYHAKVEDNTVQEKQELPRQRCKKNKIKYQKSLWTLEENLKYAAFLESNKELFDLTVYKRKAIKLNHLISQAVGSRSPIQCRSHHQKMLKHHRSLIGIIQYIRQLKDYGKQICEKSQKRQCYRIGKNQIEAVRGEEIILNLAELELNQNLLRQRSYSECIEIEYDL